MTDDLDLDRLRALEAAATPKPWTARPTPWVDEADDEDSDGARAWWVSGLGWLDIEDGLYFPPEDAIFVAATRSAVPALIAEVERLREYVTHLEHSWEVEMDVFGSVMEMRDRARSVAAALEAENAELRRRLAEAHDALRAT